MSQETLNILLGAGIAILASLVTSIAAFIFQSIDAKRKRIWQQKDAVLLQIRLVKEKRIDQIEELLNVNMKAWNDILFGLTNEKNISKAIDAILYSICYNESQIAPAGILNDHEITRLLKEFSKITNEIYSEITDHGIDAYSLDVLKDVLKYSDNVQNAYARAIKRLDELKISILTENILLNKSTTDESVSR